MTQAKSDATYPDLKDKVVLITGAGAGLGRAMAVAFAKQGARLLLNDLHKDAALETHALLEEFSGRAEIYPGSITDADVVDGLFSYAADTMGGVDILINNAGLSGVAPTADLSRDAWNTCLDINLSAPLFCAQHALKGMSEKQKGVILNMSSIYGVVAAPKRAAYCATKAGLAMLTKVLAVEWAEFGVRVNAIAPGYAKTALVDDLIDRGDIDVAALENRTPINRLITPEEVAALAVFLASDAASSITGQTVAPDGGWTAYGYV
ncbi:MAG: glucose 1-dehydrogenase [Pseudomonadota bacterium]